MPSFRCYLLDAEDHIRERIDIDAGALNAAIDRAIELLKARPQNRSFEIWHGAVRLYPEPRERRTTGEAPTN
jgi:hypothetical protein